MSTFFFQTYAPRIGHYAAGQKKPAPKPGRAGGCMKISYFALASLFFIMKRNPTSSTAPMTRQMGALRWNTPASTNQRKLTTATVIA